MPHTEPDDTLYARDLDGTGSPHVCSKEDPGSRLYSRVDADLGAVEHLRSALALIRREKRLPTQEEAALAATIIRRCNGHDLDVWTKEVWPDDTSDEALKNLSASITE